MIMDFGLESFKVEGKRYIICSNHKVLFMLFRPLVLYLKLFPENLVHCKYKAKSTEKI